MENTVIPEWTEITFVWVRKVLFYSCGNNQVERLID